MKRFFLLPSLICAFFVVSAQLPGNDTIHIFEADSALYCNIDSLYIDAGPGYTAYEWSTGETSEGIWVSNTGTYFLTAFDVGGGMVQDTVYVNLIMADIMQPDTLICYGDTLTLAVLQKQSPCIVAYYPFNGDTRDYSGNGFHGFVPGMPDLAADRYGNPESALSFDGQDTYMFTSFETIRSTISFSVWFRMPDTSFWYEHNTHPTIFDFSDGQAVISIAGNDPGNITSGRLGKVRIDHFEGAGSPGSYSLESASSPAFGEWHHLCAIFDTAGLPNQIWINGVKQAELIATGSIQPDTNRTLFGRAFNPDSDSSYFIGRIDEVNVYNCALDSIEIQYLYKSGSIYNYRYYWDTGDTASVISVSPREKKTYYATVTDGLNVCSDSVVVDVNPEIELTLEQLDIGCPGEEKAKMLARVSGGTAPYIIQWDEQIRYLQGDTLALGLTDSLDYAISVIDSIGCRLDETFQVEAKIAPNVSFEYLPEEVYYQNPVVSFTSETENATNWSWNFGDGELSSLENPEHVFNKVDKFRVVLVVTADNGCVDSTEQEIDIKEVELTIPNVFTPNGDGINDTFVVKELDKYISNRLVVFNRWGASVFEQNDYVSGDWDGGNLSDGTYFYVLKCKGYFSDDDYKGTVNIFTGGLK